MIFKGLAVYYRHPGSRFTVLVGRFEGAHPGHAKGIDLCNRNLGGDRLKLDGAIGLVAAPTVGLRGLSHHYLIGAANFCGVSC